VSVGEVGAIDDWVEHVAAQLGASEQAAFGARLCIAELAANVLEHGISCSGHDHIIITIDRLGDRIGVEFSDSRVAFDPTLEVSAECDPTSVGGRGLVLLHAYADDLSYVNDGAYNRLKFKVKSP
jgi:anti-sigma regulatory factor (Ser/Thr protein kinase)